MHALRGVGFRIRRGELVVLRGRSGSGKTTLLNLVGGLDRPDSGVVSVAGERLDRIDGARMLRLRRERMAFIFQSFGLIPMLSAAENIGIPLRIAGVSRREREDRVQLMLAIVGLTDHAAQRPGELSGGQQQRVAIARAVIGRPSLLLADEPTGNVDDEMALRLLRLFEEMNKLGTTLVIATHNEGLVQRFGHARLHLENGELTIEHARERQIS